MELNKIIQGDCIEVMKTMPENSVDTIITDPPAGISFMGKKWDSNKGGRDKWIEWLTEVMKECYRVAKPGSTALVWAIPRTSHWTATAIENAGWQVKDIIMHIFGSGFPKSHNIGKSTNKKEWTGYGTALKPAAEHWIVAQKPNEGTYANNALKWGVSGLYKNEGDSNATLRANTKGSGRYNKTNPSAYDLKPVMKDYNPSKGRFPANIILDEEAGKQLGEPSRFFYVAKASKSERGEENNHPTVKPLKLMEYLCTLTKTPTGGNSIRPLCRKWNNFNGSQKNR